MIEFDGPTRLNAPIGNLLFNQAMILGDGSTGYFMLNAEQSKDRRSLRATSDDVPQGDGRILHRRFSSGTELTLVVQLWERIASSEGLGDGDPACGKQLRLMLETLGLYLQAVLNGRGRWFWEPTDYADERMLDDARWLVDVSRDLSGKITTVTFGLDSPWPYFIDATERFGSDTTIPDGDTAVITNDGNHETYPVIEVYGATSAFTIINHSEIDDNGDPLQIVYDAAIPVTPPAPIGGSDFAEIITFRNSIYLNGNQANLKKGLDVEETDFFTLRPGDNEIEVIGADVAFRFNNAWVPV